MTLSPRHLLLAALLHLALFILLFTGVQCSKKIESPPVVQGVLINPSQIPHPQPPQPVAPPQVKPQEDQGPQPKVDAEEVAEQAKQEQKKQEEQEQQKKEAAEAEKQKQLADQKQKEEDQAIALKKQEEEAQKKAQEQADAAKRADDLKKQAAQEEQERQAAALAEKQKAEAAKRQAEQRKAAAADLQQQLGMESAQLTAQMQSDWAVQLSAAIKRAWARPPGTDESLRAYLHITLSEGGQVQSARIVTSSGVPIFDESVKGAVYKASPLPLPRDPSAFDSNITICFSPNPQSCQQ
jgi:colicin import membrane protein